MEKHNLGLVTIFHPDRLLGDLRVLPHKRRSRKNTDAWHIQRTQEGKLDGEWNYRNAPRYDTGQERKRLSHRIIEGKDLAAVLAEFRLIYIYDEPNPKAKWKLENRKNWPDHEGAFDEKTNKSLIAKISLSLLQIKGLWINYSVDNEKWGSNAMWVNLVLLPLKAGQFQPDIKLKYYWENERLMIEWNEE